MVSIVILTLAILPMMSMFDMGLHSATMGSNYDKVREFGDSQIEQAHALAYAYVQDNFPVASSTPNAAGNYTSSALTVPASEGLPPGSTYTVTKQYMALPPKTPGPSPEDFQPCDQTSPDPTIACSPGTGLIRITVTVQWANNSYRTFGFVTQ